MKMAVNVEMPLIVQRFFKFTKLVVFPAYGKFKSACDCIGQFVRSFADRKSVV